MKEPTADLELYDEQLKVNNAQMEGLLKTIFPDLEVPYGELYQILSFLEETQINPQVLPKVIRGIHNIEIGTGKGQVIVHVQQQMVNVSLREQDEEIKTKV
jgi:hypothetical protein